MRQKRICPLLVAVILLWMTGCAHGIGGGEGPSVEESSQEWNTGVQTEQPANAGWSDEARLTVLFTEPETGCAIAASDLLDTLFIAGGAYYHFESRTLLPPEQEHFKDVKEHFAPYQDHALVQRLAPYMDDEMQDINGDAVALVLPYVVCGQVFYEDSPVFKSAAEVEELISELYAFYVDTGAGEFLRTNRLRTRMEEYIPTAAAGFPVAELFTAMELYTGNREREYGDTPLQYYSVLTPYRPGMASFYPFQIGENGALCLVSQQSPYSMADGALDIRQTMETAIHESLHMFINRGVGKREKLIESLTEGVEPGGVTCRMYCSHPWVRITDEAVVRAVQAGIYRTVYGDGQRAFEEILAKEIRSGIVNLDVMYEKLREYEDNRVEYRTIDDFLDNLITAYYTGS